MFFAFWLDSVEICITCMFGGLKIGTYFSIIILALLHAIDSMSHGMIQSVNDKQGSRVDSKMACSMARGDGAECGGYGAHALELLVFL